MNFIWEKITEWLKNLLVGGIISNLTGMFDSINDQVADVAAVVGSTPQGWNASVFNMVKSLSENVIIPIAGLILTFVMTYELIQMIIERNNMAEFETFNFFKWIMKTFCAVMIVTNTWNIVMGIFEVAQTVVNNAAGVIIADTAIDLESVITNIEERLMEMDVGTLFGLWFQTMLISIVSWALTICIFVVVYPVLETYFALQYDFDTEVRNVTRYRDGEPYTYSICTVTLVNKNLSHQPVYSMSRRQLGLYAMYMSTLGNMPDIFSGNPYASELKEPVIYDVPQAYLDADPNFALLITEATKYVGYPYVWGGDSPETSFDCSGFLSYIYTVTGVRNTGRLGATGLYHACEPVAPEDARPGDMVFFEGTMGGDVSGITHCGLYVGDGMMIHCGNPIGYADLNDSYWRTHFHSFGRAY